MVTVFAGVGDVEAALDKAVSLGGTIVQPATQAPGITFGLFADRRVTSWASPPTTDLCPSRLRPASSRRFRRIIVEPARSRRASQMNGRASAGPRPTTRYDGAVAVDVGDPAERRLRDDAAGRAHQRVERQHGRPLLGRDHAVDERLAQRSFDGEDHAPTREQDERDDEARRSGRSGPASTTFDAVPANRASVRRRNSRRTRGTIRPPTICAPATMRGREAGDAVRRRVAVQLEQVRLERRRRRRCRRRR